LHGVLAARLEFGLAFRSPSVERGGNGVGHLPLSAAVCKTPYAKQDIFASRKLTGLNRECHYTVAGFSPAGMVKW